MQPFAPLVALREIAGGALRTASKAVESAEPSEGNAREALQRILAEYLLDEQREILGQASLLTNLALQSVAGATVLGASASAPDAGQPILGNDVPREGLAVE
ncbi:Hypotetical protein [Gulosibacter molinativorax]|nr:Hypotetical protein [Gulosibacter molinativorax]